MYSKRIVSGAIAALILSACSGHAGGIAPLPLSPAGLAAKPALDAHPANAARSNARLTLRLRIPRRRHHRHDSAYVSAATLSVKVVENGKNLGVFNTTATTRGCTTQTGAVICSLKMGAIPGKKRVVTVAAYSAANGGGQLLSSGSTVQTIVLGKLNTIPVTMNGIPATIALALSNPNPVEGSSSDITLTVTVQDAAGETIVGPGNFAPAIALSNSDTSGATTLSASSVTSPSSETVTVHYNGAHVAATFTGSASGAASGSAALASKAPTSNFQDGVWTALPGYGSTAYYKGDQTAPDGILKSSAAGLALGSATALAVDSQGGVIAADANGNIARWAINAINDVVPTEYLTGAGNVSALTWDPKNGRIIYATTNASSFCVLPAGASGAVAGVAQACYTNAQAFPISPTVSGLAVDPNTGNLYVANQTMCNACSSGDSATTAILAFRLVGGSYVLDHTMTTSNAGWIQGQLAFDPINGRLWETLPNYPEVESYLPSSTDLGREECDVYTPGFNSPTSVAWDGQNGIWIGDSQNAALAHDAGIYDGAGNVVACPGSNPPTLQLLIGPGNGGIAPANLAVFHAT